LTDGQLKVGDELAILPQELHGRVRGLQTHKRKEEAAIPGSRTAVNISGVNVDQIQRGNVITHPGDYRATRRVDVRFRLLPDTSGPLQHNTETKLFIGAAEVVARVRLLGSEVLIPGQEGWLQLELSEPIVAVRGDRYILRRPSPGETLGGGIIIDPHPKGRHKRFDEDNLARLKALEQGTPAELLAQALQALGISTLRTAFIKSNLNESIAHQALEELFNERQIIVLEGSPHELPGPDSLVISAANWTIIAHRAIQEVENYHKSFPLRRGMPREELKSRLKPVIRIELSTRLYLAILRRLVIEGALEESGPLVFRPGHAIHFDIAQQRQIENLLKHFAASPYAPPSTKECQAEIGEELLNALLETGVLVQVAPEVVFRKEDYERMKADVRYMLQQQGTLTAASVRDHYNTSRKYALAFLEHLDAIGMTVREGDFRKLK
jgi:selenocysteine-specific elongation factor